MTPLFKTATAALLWATLASTAMAQDASALWQGFYGGLQVSSIDPNSDTPVNPTSGTGFGLFGGYNHAISPNWVLGGELSLGSSDHGIPAGTLSIENAVTARARAGYAFDNVMIYGSLGYMSAGASVTGVPFDLDLDGVVFGLGVEAMLSERVSARIEYNQGNLDLTGPGTDIGVTTDVISAGVAFHF